MLNSVVIGYRLGTIFILFIFFSSKQMVAQHNARKFHPSKKAGKLKWVVFQESIPNINELPIKNKIPLELYSLTKDTSDYAWYSTR